MADLALPLMQRSLVELDPDIAGAIHHEARVRPTASS